MQDKNNKPAFWLMPLAFVLPFAAIAAFVAVRYGSLLIDLIHVAAKAVLIP